MWFVDLAWLDDTWPSIKPPSTTKLQDVPQHPELKCPKQDWPFSDSSSKQLSRNIEIAVLAGTNCLAVFPQTVCPHWRLHTLGVQGWASVRGCNSVSFPWTVSRKSSLQGSDVRFHCAGSHFETYVYGYSLSGVHRPFFWAMRIFRGRR